MSLLKIRERGGVKQLSPVSQGDGSPLAPEHYDLPEMSFIDHLEDLRWTILKSLGGILLMTIVCSFFASWIIDVLLLGPTRADFFMYRLFGLDASDIQLQNRDITGQFFAYWGTVLAVGLVAGSPVLVYQIWRFIEPGLYQKEKRGLRFAAFFATFFFVCGLAFGYLIITPLSLQFFQQFSISDQIVNEFDISRYFSMTITWSFGAGLLFELPVVVYFLAKLGLVSAAAMRKARKYALIVILIVAAVLTPPDVISQILVSIPLLILYEMSIFIAEVVGRNRQRELDEALS
jgi:sec-independent protein translocase protein TatC